MFVDGALSSKDGAFIEYSWAKPNERNFAKKLGFVKLYQKRGWVVGSGLYLEDIESVIKQSKKALEDRVDRYITLVVVISSFVILFLGILSFIVASKTNEAFESYNKEKERAMFHQSRLARMGVMISMIAHQWRQPLTELSSILMELETALKFKQMSEKMVQGSIKESERIVEFMSNTIEDFRNFFKPDKEAKEFLVDESCFEAIHLIEATLQNQNITLYKEIQSKAKVFGYPREFAQVIINLLTNAKDILLERSSANPMIKISSKVENQTLFVVVQDNGGGVDAQIEDKIFDPYFSTKKSTQGSGLGLYMSKMIIEKNMGGELVYQKKSDGAQFTIKIPL
jgi:signal transduction histidine kinase